MTMLLEPAETTVTSADAPAAAGHTLFAAGRADDLCTDATCVYCCGPETD